MRAKAAFTVAGVIALGSLYAQSAGAQVTVTELPEVSVTASRLGGGIVGTSTSVVTAEEIARSPATTIQEVLSEQAGVQVQNLYGAANGARTSVDIRGFGVFAPQNTLVMINGRRINDLDLDLVDFSSIPKNSIERIEITRGNSGAVLYGDNAVGGVVNIITKSPVGAPPAARIEAGFGSYGQRELNASASSSHGPWSASVYGSAVRSDGYRRHNELVEQSGVGEVRYTVDGFSAFLNVTGDDQRLNLPGVRKVIPSSAINQIATDPRGANTPFDYANRQIFSVTTGFARQFNEAIELVVDGGIRQKKQIGAYFSQISDPDPSAPTNYGDTTLTIASFTPRFNIRSSFFGMPVRSTLGFDAYNNVYESDRSLQQGSAPIHHYDLTQRTLAIYGQSTIAVTPRTDASFGVRGQYMTLTARDGLDITAPGGCPFGPPFCPVAATALDKGETQPAFHAGLEHRLTNELAIFTRAARAFRTPNVDERIGVSSYPNPANFSLRTQTSYDGEVGMRWTSGPLWLQASIYDMRLRDELHYVPFPPLGADVNLDPTRRYGAETSATYRVSDAVRLKGNVSYTRAVFREGTYIGNDVPLVARWTANGGVSWDVWSKRLTVDAVVRYIGSRVMDNDQANFQPKIPARTTADLRIGGELDQFYWSFAVQNIFNLYYYDYAIASSDPTKVGVFNAYTLPGRVFMARAGLKF